MENHSKNVTTLSYRYKYFLKSSIVLVILMYMSVKSNLRFEKLQNQFSKSVKLEKLSEEITKMVSMLKADHQDAKDLDI